MVMKENAKALLEKVSELTANEFSSFDEKLLFIMSPRFMFTRGYMKQIWFLWFYWWWCIRIVEIFRDDEKYYMNFYGLLHENLLPKKFERDITVTNILLSEIANHILIYYAKSGRGTDDIKNDCSNSDYSAISEREIKSLEYIAGYVIHKLYKRFKFTKKRRILIHTTSNAYQFYYNVKLIHTILKHESLHEIEEDYGRWMSLLEPDFLNVQKYFDLLRHNSDQC